MSYQLFKELSSLLSPYEAFQTALRKGVTRAQAQMWRLRVIRELNITGF